MNLLQRIKRYLSTDAYLKRRGIFYRRVEKYEQDGGPGEIVTLECGHQFRYIIEHRALLPCEQCARAALLKANPTRQPGASIAPDTGAEAPTGSQPIRQLHDHPHCECRSCIEDRARGVKLDG